MAKVSKEKDEKEKSAEKKIVENKKTESTGSARVKKRPLEAASKENGLGNDIHVSYTDEFAEDGWIPGEIQAQHKPPRAKTEKGREKQMVSLAVDLAEKQLREGTASAQVITHYLKLGTEREKLERQILKEQKELYAEKTKALKSMKQIEELYSEAIEAMKRYSGNGDE